MPCVDPMPSCAQGTLQTIHITFDEPVPQPPGTGVLIQRYDDSAIRIVSGQPRRCDSRAQRVRIARERRTRARRVQVAPKIVTPRERERALMMARGIAGLRSDKAGRSDLLSRVHLLV